MGNRRRLPLELLVFVVGSATLGSEIAVARLIAPFFGDSTIVWANTIAVVLVALSIGYWFGGRLADRHPHMDGLCMLVLASSVLLARRADRRPAAALAVGRRVRRRLDRRLRRLAVRRARARLDPGADARRRLAVGDPAEAAAGRGLRRDGRPDVRDLDRRLAGRDVQRLAAADPARRHAAHVPRLRAGARAGRGARAGAALAARARRRGAAAARPGRHRQGGRRGRGRARGRDAVPVRARDRVPGRAAPARAQRGPGDPLGLAARHGADRATTGTAT